MTLSATVEDFRRAAFNGAPGRLKRVVRLATALGLAGVEYADAIGEVEDAIWAEGALPIDRQSQLRAWSVARERALYAFEEASAHGADVIDMAAYRARRDGWALLDRLPDDATIDDMADAILVAEPLFARERAARIARDILASLAHPPSAQRGPAPGQDPFAETTTEPTKQDFARHRKALRIRGGAAMAGNTNVPRLATVDGEPVVVSAPSSATIGFNIQREPGLLGDLARWSLAYAFRPIPEFAQLSALATLAPLFGRRYATPTGLGLNLYLVGLASTGSGKEALIGAPPAALQAAGLGFLIGAGDFTSDSAIEVALRARPNFLAPIDEVGEFVGAAQHRNAASHSRTIRKALLELHGKSRPDGRWSGKQKADAEHDKASDPVFAPHLSILGASTGQGFFEALTEANLADGFINRLIVVQGGKPGDRNLDPARLNMPAALADALKAAYEAGAGGNLTGANARVASQKPEMRTVPWADEAAKLAWLDVADWEDDARDDGREGITGRAAANTQVVATIRALSRDAGEPAVTANDIEWAWAFVRSSIDTVERGARENMAGSEFESLVKAIEAAVVKAGAKGITKSWLLRAKGVAKHMPQMVDPALKRLEETDLIFRNIGGSNGGRPTARIVAKCFHEG